VSVAALFRRLSSMFNVVLICIYMYDRYIHVKKKMKNILLTVSKKGTVPIIVPFWGD
jgi:hypothetical protein